MNYIGPIDGMNFNPITNYNKYLKNNASFEVNSGVDFESILNKQSTMVNQNVSQLKSGIEVTMNVDDLAPQATKSTEGVGSFMKSFGNSIGGGLNSVNDATNAANKAQEALAMGEDVSVHDVMIAAEKASLSLQMAMQLRNKLLSIYTEINNVKV